jgi:hypothetical protein
MARVKVYFFKTLWNTNANLTLFLIKKIKNNKKKKKKRRKKQRKKLKMKLAAAIFPSPPPGVVGLAPHLGVGVWIPLKTYLGLA